MKASRAIIYLAALGFAVSAQAQSIDFTTLFTKQGAVYGIAKEIAPLTLDGKWSISLVMGVEPTSQANLFTGAGLSYKLSTKTGVQFSLHAGLTSDIYKIASDQKALWYVGASVKF